MLNYRSNEIEPWRISQENSDTAKQKLPGHILWNCSCMWEQSHSKGAPPPNFLKSILSKFAERLHLLPLCPFPNKYHQTGWARLFRSSNQAWCQVEMGLDSWLWESKPLDKKCSKRGYMPLKQPRKLWCSMAVRCGSNLSFQDERTKNPTVYKACGDRNIKGLGSVE